MMDGRAEPVRRFAPCRAGPWLCVLTPLLWLGSASPAGAQAWSDARLFPPAQAGGPDPGLALLGSALLPGAGQYLLGNERWVPFLALEVWGWISYLDRREEGLAFSNEYRDLAWFVARRISVGARRDTVFDYYEALANFPASGAFDADPRQPGVQPEPDPATFNGDLWALARSLFFPGGGAFPAGSPQYEQALRYYEARAIPPAFAWAWGDSNLEQQTYRELIRRSDEAYRSATQVLGVILVNHVVSAIDALVLARGAGPGASRLRLRSGLVREAAGLRWRLGLAYLH